MPEKYGPQHFIAKNMKAAVTEVEGDAAVFVLPGKYAYQIADGGKTVTVTFETREELQRFMDDIMEDRDK